MNAEAAHVLIRPMHEADLEQVMAIAASLTDAPRWPRAAYLLALESDLDADSKLRRTALVAEVPAGNSVMGFAVAGLLPPQAELESIAVSEVEQRRGIGRELIFALIEEFKGAGVGEVLLEVRASNERALGFYRSLGWRESGRRPRYYADPEEDAVLMNLILEPI